MPNKTFEFQTLFSSSCWWQLLKPFCTQQERFHLLYFILRPYCTTCKQLITYIINQKPVNRCRCHKPKWSHGIHPRLWKCYDEWKKSYVIMFKLHNNKFPPVLHSRHRMKHFKDPNICIMFYCCYSELSSFIPEYNLRVWLQLRKLISKLDKNESYEKIFVSIPDINSNQSNDWMNLIQQYMLNQNDSRWNIIRSNNQVFRVFERDGGNRPNRLLIYFIDNNEWQNISKIHMKLVISFCEAHNRKVTVILVSICPRLSQMIRGIFDSLVIYPFSSKCQASNKNNTHLRDMLTDVNQLTRTEIDFSSTIDDSITGALEIPYHISSDNLFFSPDKS